MRNIERSMAAGKEAMEVREANRTAQILTHTVLVQRVGSSTLYHIRAPHLNFKPPSRRWRSTHVRNIERSMAAGKEAKEVGRANGAS